MNGKITYSNLSVPLKIATIFSYIVGSIYFLYFILGFITGFMEAL